MISLIVAMSQNGVIGKAGKLPWHLPEDLRHFKELTMGHPIIMGRKTFESLPKKPLPGRKNIVLTRSADFKALEGVEVIHDVSSYLSTFFSFPSPSLGRRSQGYSGAGGMGEGYRERVKSPIEENHTEEIFVIGGAEIYKIFEPYIQCLYITLIEKDIEGDTYFPFNWKDGFKIVDVGAIHESPLPYRFIKAVRKETL